MKIKKIKYAKKVQKKKKKEKIPKPKYPSIRFPFETKWPEEWADEAKLL